MKKLTRPCFLFICASIISRVRSITLTPSHGCVCPGQKYTCRAENAAEVIWQVNGSSSDFSSDSDVSTNYSENGIEITFSTDNAKGGLSLSYLQLTTLERNDSAISCKKLDGIDPKTVRVCVVGSSSPPENITVTWNDSYAVVSFQPPVYGGECVDRYVVTAVSEEENITCNVTESKTTHHCEISSKNISDFCFKIQPFSRRVGSDGLISGKVAEYRAHTTSITVMTKTMANVFKTMSPNPDSQKDHDSAVITFGCGAAVLGVVVLALGLTFLVILVSKRRKKCSEYSIKGDGSALSELRDRSQSSVSAENTYSTPAIIETDFDPQYEDIDRFIKRSIEPLGGYNQYELIPGDIISEKNSEKETQVDQKKEDMTPEVDESKVPVPVHEYSTIDFSKKKKKREELKTISASNPYVIEGTNEEMLEVLPPDIPPELPPRIYDLDMEIKDDEKANDDLRSSSPESAVASTQQYSEIKIIDKGLAEVITVSSEDIFRSGDTDT